jgi:hypothetical protein
VSSGPERPVRDGQLGSCPRAPRPDAAHRGDVQIRLDIVQSAEGRLTGTLGIVGHDDAFPFSGNLELLARLEDLTAARPESNLEEGTHHE